MQESSNFGQVFTFQTDGCCVSPTNLTFQHLTASSFSLGWDTILAAAYYEVKLIAEGEADGQLFSTTETQLLLDKLEACTQYTVQVRTICKNQQITDFNSTLLIKTKNCGACTYLDYCSSTAALDEDGEWISKVVLNDLVNESESDFGYGDYTGKSTDLYLAASYDLTVGIAYTNFPFDENIQVWIDYNQDGMFEDGVENVINLDEDVSNEYSAFIRIPEDAKLGLTRMRIALKWRGGNDRTKSKSCDNYDFGEVEDYCVNIVSPLVGTSNFADDFSTLTVHPNPFSTAVNLDLFVNELTEAKINLLDISGKFVLYESIQNLTRGKQLITIETGHLPKGMYLLLLQTENGQFAKKLVKF
ncbi:MAG: GEVED domain-containing protein [Saprospiraceae bacterium]